MFCGGGEHKNDFSSFELRYISLELNCRKIHRSVKNWMRRNVPELALDETARTPKGAIFPLLIWGRGGGLNVTTHLIFSKIMD